MQLGIGHLDVVCFGRVLRNRLRRPRSRREWRHWIGALAAAGSAAPATGFGAFSGATTFAPKPKGSEPAQAPAASVPSNECPTPSDEPPSTVEAAVTGEEDEMCIHRVRAKLFRLEVRMEVVRKDEKHPDAPDLAEGGGGGGDGAATVEADDAAKSDAATTAPATDAKRSSLNPDAKPFVPAGGGAAADAGAAAAGGEAGEAGKKKDEASKGAAAKDDEGGGGEEEDDEEDDNKPAAVPEDASGPLQEVTRWAERGVGQLRLLVHKSSVAAGGTGTGASVPFPRLVMRVEHVGRLILNEALLPSTAPAQKVSDTSIRLVVVSAAAAGPQSYLFRVKTPAEAAQLLDFINKTIPAEAK